jgi:hypothetical protein
VNSFRQLFEIEGWKKYSIALLAIMFSGIALNRGMMTGAEFSLCLGAIIGLFGLSDVGSKWVGKTKESSHE